MPYFIILYYQFYLSFCTDLEVAGEISLEHLFTFS